MGGRYAGRVERSTGKHFYLSTGLYALHLTQWLSRFDPSQFLFVNLTQRNASAAAELLRGLADHLQLSLPRAPLPKWWPPSTCYHARLVTRTGARLKRRNGTTSTMQAAFEGSPLGASVRAFLGAHHAQLPPLLQRHRIKVLS